MLDFSPSSLAVSGIVILCTIYFFLLTYFPVRTSDPSGPKIRLGLIPALEYEGASKSAGVDIVFVHGLGADPRYTWRASSAEATRQGRWPLRSRRPKDVCWVSQFVYQDLMSKGRDRDRLWFYNYDATWYRDAVNSQLGDHAKIMIDHVNSMIHAKDRGSGRRLVFVGHSYGCLVIREVLVQAQRSPKFQTMVEQTKGVLFLGGPHLGTDYTKFGLVIAILLRPFGAELGMLFELTLGCHVLKVLDVEFRRVLISHKIRVMNFVESKKSRMVSWVPFGRFFIPKESSEMRQPAALVENYSLYLDHSALNKFSERNKDYGLVFDKLIDLIQPLHRETHLFPQNKVSSFVSRLNLSARLNNLMMRTTGLHDQAHGVLIHGMPGSGKTQLVYDFVYQHSSAFNPILWVDATTTYTVRDCFQRFTESLGLEGIPTKLEHAGESNLMTAAMKTVLEFLSEQDSHPWLVVFDNANNDDENFLWNAVPNTPCANVLLTRRQPYGSRQLDPRIQQVEIDMLEVQEARKLLFMGIKHGDPSEHPPRTLQLADQILERLGFLALAVDQASAYIELEQLRHTPVRTWIVIDEALQTFLRDLRRHPKEMLNLPLRSRGYEGSIEDIWELSLAAIDRRFPEYHVYDLLTLLAVFDRASIEKELFRQAATGLDRLCKTLRNVTEEQIPEWLRQYLKSDNGEWDDFVYERVSMSLISFRLLHSNTSSGDSRSVAVRLHSLVQRHARTRLNINTWPLWLIFFLASASMGTLLNNDVSGPTNMILSRHLVCAYKYLNPAARLKALPLTKQDCFAWVNETGAWELIALSQAANIFNASTSKILPFVIESRIALFGVESEHTLAPKLSLAQRLIFDLQLDEARKLLWEVYTTGRDLLGDKHSLTMGAMSRLPGLLVEQGKLRKAIKMQDAYAELLQEMYGGESTEYIDALLDLARMVEKQGEVKVAEHSMVYVTAVLQISLGRDHPKTLDAKRKLAGLWARQGRSEAALQQQASILATFVAIADISNESHIDLSLKHIQEIYERLGDEYKAYLCATALDELVDARHQRWLKGDTIERRASEREILATILAGIAAEDVFSHCYPAQFLEKIVNRVRDGEKLE